MTDPARRSAEESVKLGANEAKEEANEAVTNTTRAEETGTDLQKDAENDLQKNTERDPEKETEKAEETTETEGRSLQLPGGTDHDPTLGNVQREKTETEKSAEITRTSATSEEEDTALRMKTIPETESTGPQKRRRKVRRKATRNPEGEGVPVHRQNLPVQTERGRA